MLKRKTPLKGNLEKHRAWQERSRHKAMEKAKGQPRTSLAKGAFKTQRSSQRAREESTYAARAKAFLSLHRVCPVTGGNATQIHHAAKRDGAWLLLERHWIAVSQEGHAIIEANKKWAEKIGLMKRIYLTYHEYVDRLFQAEIMDLERPVYYLPDAAYQQEILATLVNEN